MMIEICFQERVMMNSVIEYNVWKNKPCACATKYETKPLIAQCL